MNTKVRKKGSKREKVPSKTIRAWAKAKNEQKKTVFDLMVATGLSEGTLRNALKGYADRGTVVKLNEVFFPKQTEAA